MRLALKLCLAVTLYAGPAASGPGTAADDGPAEIYFVFGSDTSTGGILVDTHDILYRGRDVALYVSPTGLAASAMDASWRAGLTDWYGDPIRLTWWMQGGSLYQPALNTNVPLASTIAPHLMLRYHGEAIEQFGDEVSVHYHTWKWTDYAGDGRYYWNQTSSFEESRSDFDLTLAQFLIEEGIYPVSFRSGWHYMDNLWQARLDELLPFSLHNDSPNRRTGVVVEPIDNVYDWFRAPLDFIPFRPRADDYQLPGGSGGWNVRSRYLKWVDNANMHQIFQAASDGTSQVVCLWSHLAELDFIEQIEDAVAIIHSVAADFPEVRFRFTTAVDGMQRWLETTDLTPPELTVEQSPREEAVVLSIQTNEDIFQSAPFVAAKDRYERYHVIDAEPVGFRAWEAVLPYDAGRLASAAVAVTDSVGNLAIQTVEFVPEDIFVDNSDGGYSELEGSWQTVSYTEVEQVWGRDFRRALLGPGQEATAAWSVVIGASASYNVFVRLPAVDRPVPEVGVTVAVNGVARAAADVALWTAVRPAEWVYVTNVSLQAGDVLELEMSATGEEGGVVLAADAIRLSPLVRDRQLEAPGWLDFGDVFYDAPSPVTVRLRNLGSEELTISGVSSSSGTIRVAESLPVSIGGMGARDLELELEGTEPGQVLDTLVVMSDDPVRPEVGLPVSVRFMDYFVDVDNDDPIGYTETGTWYTSVTQAYGASSRYTHPTDLAAKAVYSTTVERAGTYDLSFIVPSTINSALRARYVVLVSGEVLETVVVNQNDGSGDWRSLGLYQVIAGADVTVEVRWDDLDQADLVLRADAIRLSFLGDELDYVIRDNDDPEGYIEHGPWQTSVDQAYGPSSRFVPASAEAWAKFLLDAEQTRLHAIEMIVPATVNASLRARYRIKANGVPLDAVYVDQNVGSGSWRLLGSYLLRAGDHVEVEVSHAHHTHVDQVLRADAVRLTFGAGAVSVAEPHEQPLVVTLGPGYPNPARDRLSFEYTVPQPERVSIRLYDVLGRLVDVLVDGEVGPGHQTITYDVSRLASGHYFCRLEVGGQVKTRTWVVLR